MQPRTLQQILSELAPAFDPQVANIQQRQSLIPQQIKAEEQGLQAKQGQAFDSILGGARRRGLGFSGIPLGEQAKYTATEYLPALARLRQTGREQAMSLEDAILGIRERQRGQAMGIYQTEQDRAFQREMQERQLAEQRRASAAANSFSPSFGGIGGAGGNLAAPQQGYTGMGGQPSKIDKLQQDAYNDVRTRVGQQTAAQLQSDYLATARSAKNGNQRDLIKLQLYRQLAPNLFKVPYSWENQSGLQTLQIGRM